MVEKAIKQLSFVSSSNTGESIRVFFPEEDIILRDFF